MATLSEIERSWGYDEQPEFSIGRYDDIEANTLSYADCLQNKRYGLFFHDEYPYMYIHTCRIYTSKEDS